MGRPLSRILLVFIKINPLSTVKFIFPRMWMFPNLRVTEKLIENLRFEKNVLTVSHGWDQ